MNADLVRWINLTLSSAVVILMIMGTMKRWEDLPARLKRIIPWVIFTYVILAYSSGEVLHEPGVADPGYRVILLLLNLVGLLIALLWEFDKADYSDKSDAASTLFARGRRFSLKLFRREKS